MELESTIHADCETHPVSPTEQAPPVVCLQWCYQPAPLFRRDAGGEGVIVDDPDLPWRGMTSLDILGPVPDDEYTEDDNPAEEFQRRTVWPEETTPQILTGDDVLDFWRQAMESGHLIRGVNLSYDILCLIRHAERRGLNLWRQTLEWLAAGRYRDTEIDEKLIAIARGITVYKTGLEGLARRYLDLDLGDDKHGPSSWRLRYRELEGVPLCDWPYHAKRYALDDPLLDREISRRQLDVAVRLFGKPFIPDQVARPVARFCLHLQSSRGVLTDYPRAILARSSLEELSDHLMKVLVGAGLVNSKVIFTGSDALSSGASITVDGNPAVYRYRSTKAGEPSERARHAVVEFDSGEEEIVELRQIRTEEAVKHTKNTKEIRKRIAETLKGAGYPVPETETGLTKTDRETLELIAELSDDPGLLCLTAKNKTDKLLSTYVGALCTRHPMHWRYDCLKDTGRTSAAAQRFTVESAEGIPIKIKEGTNVQNFPGTRALERTAAAVLPYLPPAVRDAPGAVQAWAAKHNPRAMVVARPGYVFSIYDYTAIELGCMARVLNVLFKKPSTLAQVINTEGMDPHLYTGVSVHRTLWGESLTYEQLVERHKEAKHEQGEGRKLHPALAHVLDTRKMSKIVGFGFLGGMGAKKFMVYAKSSYGVDVPFGQSKALRQGFLQTYPEIPLYFKATSDRLAEGLPIIQIGTRRVRRGCTYTSACNSPFQGLAADGAMQALWLLTWASYADEGSPLFGSFPLIFEHDAFIVEVPEGPGARAAHEEVGRLMIQGMNVYLEDQRNPELSVKVRVEGDLIERTSDDPHSRWIK